MVGCILSVNNTVYTLEKKTSGSSYDKLKPYGICINGSWNIIWLQAALTNSDLKVFGGYFVEAVERCGGCPKLIGTDVGTEDVVIRDLQWCLRRNDMDDRAAERSYITGASATNHRTESWWGVMRKEGINTWITLLAELKDEGFFTGDFIDKALSQFSFMPIIQVNSLWYDNSKKLRNCTINSTLPSCNLRDLSHCEFMFI